MIDELLTAPDATILFEAPSRLPRLLADLAAAIPDRPAAVCRELTKRYEEIARGTCADLAARYAKPPKGEITLVVEAAPEPEAVDAESLRGLIRARLEAGERTKAIAKALAAEHGVSRREVYALVLEEESR